MAITTQERILKFYAAITLGGLAEPSTQAFARHINVFLIMKP